MTFNREKNSCKVYERFIALLLLMTAILGICNQINIIELVIFVCFQILCVFIPGIAIMVLLPISNLREVERVLFSYASGYVLTMILYAVVMLTAGKDFLRIAFALMAIVSIAIIWRHLKSSEQREIITESDDKMWCWTVLAVFGVFLIVSLRWKLPYAGGSNGYELDFLTWANNIVAMKSENFMSTIMNSRYHYLGPFQLAALSRVTGISVIKVAAYYSRIEETIFYALSSYVLVNRFIKNRKARFIALLIMLFSTGLEEKALVAHIWHVILMPMSFNIALSFGVMTILLMLIQLEEEFDINKLIMVICFLMCCTGTKGAAGAVIFCGIGIACFYLFFYKKERKTAFIYAFFSVIGFGSLFLYLMPTAKSFSDNAALTSEVIYLSRELESTSDINWVISYIKYYVLANPWVFVPAGVFIVYSAIRKSIKKEHIILFLTTIIGVTLGYGVQFYGNSNQYFTLMVFPFAALLSGCLVEEIFENHISDKKQVIFSGIICAAVLAFTVSADYGHRCREWIVNGICNLYIPAPPSRAIGTIPYPQSVVTKDEYQAYQWILENTDEDVILLSDKIDHIKHLMAVRVFTERSVHYDEENEACFNGDERILEKYADSGIDYIIQNKNNSPMFICPKGMGEIAFENDEMVVYYLTEN